MIHQRTISKAAAFSGTALHCGQYVTVTVLPAPDNSGIIFVRMDLSPQSEIRAIAGNVSDTSFATSLAIGEGAGRFSISTVEHLLAAAASIGLDNLRIEVDGPEIPILDGSAQPFLDSFSESGARRQQKLRRFLVIKKKVEVIEGNQVARIEPSAEPIVTCSIDFDHPLVPTNPYTFTVSEQSFRHEIAPARTFGFLKDVDELRARGLALGASVDNAVVIEGDGVLNPGGLRFSNEFVRHKILDAIGDLSLLGMPFVGAVTLHRSGHRLNLRLVQAILADSSTHEIQLGGYTDYPRLKHSSL